MVTTALHILTSTIPIQCCCSPDVVLQTLDKHFSNLHSSAHATISNGGGQNHSEGFGAEVIDLPARMNENLPQFTVDCKAFPSRNPKS